MNGNSTPTGEALRDLVRTEIAASGLSQRQVSRESGVDRDGSSKLNQWLKGSYTGDNETIEAALRRWLAQRELERQDGDAGLLDNRPAWVETRAARAVHSTLTLAQRLAVTVIVQGGAGLGKTCTANHYRLNHNNVWLVTATPAVRTYSGILRRIARQVDSRGDPGSTAAMEESLIERMQGTKGLLVVDEAQLLGIEALWGIKHLFDQSGIGLAYVGSERISINFAGRVDEWNAPLIRRITKRTVLKKPTAEDVAALLDGWGIASDPAVLGPAAEIAALPGSLGLLTEVLRLATLLGEGRVSGESLRAAARECGGMG